MKHQFVFFFGFYRFEELVEAKLVEEESGDSVEGVESVDDDHEHEPEPHGQVHLLVDDVLKYPPDKDRPC